jgi:hypothetical protein
MFTGIGIMNSKRVIRAEGYLGGGGGTLLTLALLKDKKVVDVFKGYSKDSLKKIIKQRIFK